MSEKLDDSHTSTGSAIRLAKEKKSCHDSLH